MISTDFWVRLAQSLEHVNPLGELRQVLSVEDRMGIPDSQALPSDALACPSNLALLLGRPPRRWSPPGNATV